MKRAKTRVEIIVAKLSKVAASAAVGLACTLAVEPAAATPYASGISVAGGTVSFLLNEDADSVVVKRTGDTDLTLGALTKGTQSFPLGSATAYSIEVSKSSTPGWTKISDDTSPQNQFFIPRGVAVNRNPASPYFGTVYVSEGTGGATADRPLGTLEGIYALGADGSDIFGMGDDSAFGNVAWDSSSENSPFRIHVAPDDSIYISDWSDSHSGVWRAPADLADSPAWPRVLGSDSDTRNGSGLTSNHGSISSVWVEGTGANTVLYTLDEDWPDANPDIFMLEGRGDILRYDIGTRTEVTDAPIVHVDDNTPAPAGVILNGRMDFVRDEDGSWWVGQFRFDDSASVPSLTRWLDGGTAPVNNYGPVDTNNPQPGELDLDRARSHLDIHNETDKLIVGTYTGFGVYVLDISDPDNVVLTDTIPQTGTVTDVSFDAAGNVYITNRTEEVLSIWSPGGDWIATTNSDGTFSLQQILSGVNADFNGDDLVDGADFLTWQRNFGINDGTALLSDGDADGDGNVLASDLAAWQSQFSTDPTSTATAAAAPEPASLALVACMAAAGGCGMVVRRRRSR